MIVRMQGRSVGPLRRAAVDPRCTGWRRDRNSDARGGARGGGHPCRTRRFRRPVRGQAAVACSVRAVVLDPVAAARSSGAFAAAAALCACHGAAVRRAAGGGARDALAVRGRRRIRAGQCHARPQSAGASRRGR